jgi:uncharacterized protein
VEKQIIGAVHFPPLPGYPDYPGFKTALKNALFDTKAFEAGGATALIIENNYDIPHTEKISEAVLREMILLGKEIKKNTKLPIGVSVLWNDYASAFRIAQEIGGTFIRIPVFVDTVKTDYGIIKGNPENVMSVRKKLQTENIKIYTDIHVKHAKILSPQTIEQSAELAIKNGADVLILTGKWTGEAPDLNDLINVRKTVGNFPILCGSGVDNLNIKKLFQYADGCIVSTSLKENSDVADRQNIKPYTSRIIKNKVAELVSAC